MRLNLLVPRHEYWEQNWAVLGQITHHGLQPYTLPAAKEKEKPPEYAEIKQNPALCPVELIDNGLWIEQLRQDVWSNEAAGRQEEDGDGPSYKRVKRHHAQIEDIIWVISIIPLPIIRGWGIRKGRPGERIQHQWKHSR